MTLSPEDGFAIAEILHQDPFNFAIWVSLLLMAPMMLISSFKKLSAFNLLGCISTLLVSFTILGLVLGDMKREKMPIQVPPPSLSIPQEF